MAKVAVALEVGAKRVFAIAIDWPGWSRSGRSEEEALAALASYAPRYAAVIGEAGLTGALAYDVAEHLSGNAGTDFGAPGMEMGADARPLDDAELARQQGLLGAAWRAFDSAAAFAAGKELRTGPRGGGRDQEKMARHVLESEEAYLAQLGSRRPKPPALDPSERLVEVRAAALAALAARAHGGEPSDPSGVRSRWSPRYFVRRSAWHALDHAWELEDRIISS